jgi:hypothetical protein
MNTDKVQAESETRITRIFTDLIREIRVYLFLDGGRETF